MRSNLRNHIREDVSAETLERNHAFGVGIHRTIHLFDAAVIAICQEPYRVALMVPMSKDVVEVIRQAVRAVVGKPQNRLFYAHDRTHHTVRLRSEQPE